MTLADLFRKFPDDATAEAWFIVQRWPDGVRCPHCDCDRVQDGAAHRNQRFRCRGCGKRFSTRTDTVMADSNLGFQDWAIAVYAVLTNLKGVSSMKLHRDLGITQSSAWFLLHRIREAWASRDDEPMAGPVEADEMYVGGKARNMHRHRANRLKPGRSTQHRTPVMGVKDRGTNRVAARPVSDVGRATIGAVISETVEPGATVFTDEWHPYRTLASMGYAHGAVAHKTREYVRGDAHTNGIESLWSMFKRGYTGTYHKMSRAHLHRYVNEFTGRHNIRPLDTEAQMASVAAGMVGKRLRYDDLIATPEPVGVEPW
jgi:transposase-like protein